MSSDYNLPIDSIESPRFCGMPTFMRLKNTTDVRGVDVAVVGIPSDNGAPYRNGERFAPGAIRSISAMLRPISPYHQNLNVFEILNVVDYGDVPVVPGYFEETYSAIEQYCRKICSQGVTILGLGGDHSVTLPQLRALKGIKSPVALLHFDSHSDTWDSYFAGKKYSAGTMFRRAVEENLINPERSIQIGMRGSLFRDNDNSQSLDLGYHMITTDTLFSDGIEKTAERILEEMKGMPVFISFDLDFVDPSAAPGVATPECGGPSSRETLKLIRLLEGLDIVGCDVVEYCPSYDGRGQITGLLAATVASEFLSLKAYHSCFRK